MLFERCHCKLATQVSIVVLISKINYRYTTDTLTVVELISFQPSTLPGRWKTGPAASDRGTDEAEMLRREGYGTGTGNGSNGPTQQQGAVIIVSRY